METRDTSLYDFFVNKYEQASLQLKAKRQDSIDQMIKGIDEEIAECEKALDLLHEKEKEYHQALTNLQKWQQDLDQANFNQTQLIKEYETSRNQIYEKLNDYDQDFQIKVREYQAIVNFSDPIDVDFVNRAIRELIDYFQNEGYQKSLEFLGLIQELKALNNDFEGQEFMLNRDIIDLTNDIAHIEPYDPALDINDLVLKLDEITVEKHRIEKVKDSIENLFTLAKTQDLAKMKESYDYDELIGLSKKEIGEKLEVFLENFLIDLANKETDVEREYKLYKRHQALMLKLSELEPIIHEHYVNADKYNHLKEKLSLLKEKMNQLDIFVNNSYQVINSDQIYRKIYNAYIANLVETTELTKNLEQVETHKQELLCERKTLISNPYAKNDIAVIDQKLKDLELEKLSYQDRLNSINAYNQKLQEDYHDFYQILVNKTAIENNQELFKQTKELLEEELAQLLTKLEKTNSVVDEYDGLKTELEDINEQLQTQGF